MKVKISYGGETIVEGNISEDINSNENIIVADGNYYASQSTVNPEVFERLIEDTTDTYTCPYKGTCNWVNLVDSEGQIIKPHITWIYRTSKEGWEMIKDKYGFYRSTTNEIDVVTE